MVWDSRDPQRETWSTNGENSEQWWPYSGKPTKNTPRAHWRSSRSLMLENPPLWLNESSSPKKSWAKFLHSDVKHSLQVITSAWLDFSLPRVKPPPPKNKKQNSTTWSTGSEKWMWPKTLIKRHERKHTAFCSALVKKSSFNCYS